VLLLAVTTVTVQAQTQFAGTWTLDPAHSQLAAREGGHGEKAPDAAPGQTPKEPPVVKLIARAERHQHQVALDDARQPRAHVQRVVRRPTVAADEAGPSRLDHRLEGDARRRPPRDDVQNDDAGQGRRRGQDVLARVDLDLSPDGRTLTIDTVDAHAARHKTMKTVYLKG